ncbi:alpha/beta hydrolase [Pseudenhygromyxa sp. WMMC2535]|uniref:alpha/beta hydrolase n=1 Tax=Pseudenhygromyxa sp. WMMC2535 TaxID=2712867 RepID=UPI001556CFED|nr:alpha/beta hydrolase [Pseudenhygromyxa sp. WMMC2535]NVB43112.1 alpha/beta hydrolase [Pseudenhygromyxa sp. WMMC2535]
MSAPLPLIRGLLRAVLAGPEPLLRMVAGPPPRSDRGVELDLATHALLSLMAAAKLGGIHKLPPDKARRAFDRDAPILDLPPAPGVSIEDTTLPGATGPLPCRVYRPEAAPNEDLPVLLWLHGGGFVIGSLDTHVGPCSLLAARAHCLVLAIEYRKAPEHPFPAALEDALAVVRALRKNPRLVEAHGGDPSRLVIGGDSAGGNLSAAVCQQLRDAGEPQPGAQVLVYPATDLRRGHASHTRFARGFFLTVELLDYFMGYYLRGSEDARDPKGSPLLAESLEGLAPALIHTAGFDPLRDEGHEYAARLQAAGVAVDLRCHERLIHGYVCMGGAIPLARAAIEELADALRVRLCQLEQ